MNRRGFFSGIGLVLAAPLLPIEPRRAYSFFRMDDTAYLQGLLDAAGPGDVVVVPMGRYRTSKTLQINCHVRIIGSHFITPRGQPAMHLGRDSTGLISNCHFEIGES